MIFIDTGAFIARYLPLDQHHEAAVSLWKKMIKARERILTSNFVLDETFTLLGRRAGYRFAAERARNILFSKALRILRPGRDEEMEALELFEKYADQNVSFTDCVSFVLMRRSRIERVFSFDRHFKNAGFSLWA